MPLNYQDLNFDNGQYIKQYAGTPIDQIQDTADTLSTRHYQNLANASHLEILANQMKSKLLPGAKSYVDTHISGIDQALQDMAKSGGENSTARINALATALQGDQNMLNGLQQAERVNKELAIEQELLAQGKQPIRKPGVREAIMNAPIDHEVYKTPYQSTVEPYENPVPHMENIWKQVNPDSIESMIRAAKDTELSKLLPGAYVNGQLDLPLFFESVTRAGISEGKIGKLLDSAWSSYKETPAYRQQSGVMGKSDKDIRNEVFNHGLLRVFNNISRDYKPTPAAALNGDGSKSDSGVYPTQVPAQTVEPLFDYDSDGYSKGATGGLVQSKPLDEIASGPGVVTTNLYKEQGKREYDPQYLKDIQTMQEIRGDKKKLEPGSPEAKAAAAEYKSLVSKRVSNPFVQPFNKEQASELNDRLRREYALSEYTDPLQPGKVIRPFDNNGNMTEEFKELTGGDPSKFNIESVYDPKNHYAMTTNSKFVKPVAITAMDKDGNARRFLMSQHPSNTSQQDINTNAIYTAVNLRPGQEAELANGRVKAKELHGAQLSALSPEDRANSTFPIQATVDGQSLLFSSPEHLSSYLLSKGITLSIKN